MGLSLRSAFSLVRIPLFSVIIMLTRATPMLTAALALEPAITAATATAATAATAIAP